MTTDKTGYQLMQKRKKFLAEKSGGDELIILLSSSSSFQLFSPCIFGGLVVRTSTNPSLSFSA
jgi:hypothetical protein